MPLPLIDVWIKTRACRLNSPVHVVLRCHTALHEQTNSDPDYFAKPGWQILATKHP